MKKSYKLIQHTEIIHFKPGDVPIRATELKPAFDRFLIKKINYRNDEKSFKKDYPYKVAIKYSNIDIHDIPKYDPLFFGAIKKPEIKFVTADVEVEFFAYNKEVLDLIEKYFDKFVSVHNFGMRTSKGFGSFTTEAGFIKPDVRVYSFETIKNWKKTLSYFYKSLRSGINEKGFYFKSLMYKYACENGITWEKRKIKNELGISRGSGCGNNYKIVRDLLGFSGIQRWGSYCIDERIVNCNTLPKQRRRVLQVKKSGMDRYPSPLMFKPVKISNDKYKIYFWLESWYPDVRLANRLHIKAGNRNFSMNVANELDLNKFLDFVYQQKNQIISNNSDHEINKFLKEAYGTLKVEQ
ncbi:hypothetical protein [Nautilia lithotrophica]